MPYNQYLRNHKKSYSIITQFTSENIEFYMFQDIYLLTDIIAQTLNFEL